MHRRSQRRGRPRRRLPGRQRGAVPERRFDSYGDTCGNAAFAYVGSNPPAGLIYSFYYPLEEDWNKGERKMICYVTTENLTTMTKSMKAGTQ